MANATEREVVLRDVEQGVVLSYPGADRIPEGADAARALGMRSQYYGWPALTRTADGALLVGASERVIHVDPFGREVVARSEDGGRSWSAPQVIYDSPLDDRDQNLCTLPDGTVVATWFSHAEWLEPAFTMPSEISADWQRRRAAVSPEVEAYYAGGGWLKRSHDGGHTWEADTYRTPIGHDHGPSVLHDGALVQVGRVGREPTGVSYAAARSDDGGKLWYLVGIIPCPRGDYKGTGYPIPAFTENHALELSPGHIIVAARTYTGYDPHMHIYLTESHDAGATWTVPHSLGVRGYPPHLLRLSDGAVLCTFADRRQPQRIRAMLSRDEGATWDTERVMTIRTMPYRSDMGYPVSIELAPGEIFTVYYSVVTPSHDAYHDPIADATDPTESGILSAHWWVAEARKLS